jgi:hypothetical protein
MRYTITGLILTALAFLAPYIWERVMDVAPEMAWRIVFLVFMLGGIAVVLLSDPVFSRLSNPRAHPLTSMAIVACASACIAAAVWWTVVVRTAPPLWADVTVQPKQFQLHLGGAANTTQLVVTNNSKKTLYSVWLEMSSDPDDAIEDILFDTDRDSDAPMLGVGGAQISGDVLGLSVTGDDGRSYRLIRFYQLIPGVNRRVTVTGKKPIRSTAVAKIIGAVEQPEPLLTVPAKPPKQ